MCKWSAQVILALFDRAATDAYYQRYLEKVRLGETGYLRIQKELDYESRQELEDYIANCEELQYQLTRIAYEYGWEAGYASRKGR